MRSFATLFALFALLALSRPAVSADKPDSFGIGPWGLFYAHYHPSLYGPNIALDRVVADTALPLRPDGRLDQARLLVIKDQRRLELWVGTKMVKAYRIQLSQRSKGTKTKRRDQRTPEGEYFVCGHSAGRFYRALWISYPNREDADRALNGKQISPAIHAKILEALEQGKCPPQNTKLGGDLLLHGQQPSLTKQLRRAHRKGQIKLKSGFEPGDADPVKYSTYFDWTAGCVALFNPDIRELHHWIADGTPIRIVADGPVTMPSAQGSAETGNRAEEPAPVISSTESAVPPAPAAPSADPPKKKIPTPKKKRPRK